MKKLLLSNRNKKLYLFLLLSIPFLCKSQYTVLLNFTGPNGEIPHDALFVAGGKIYGTAGLGGTDNDGLVFSLHTDGTNYADLHDFNDTVGEFPRAGVIHSGNMLYGMTRFGGANADGVVYSVRDNGTRFKDLMDFNGTNGDVPWNQFAIADSVLYGMTSLGGANYDGNIFRINIDGSHFMDLMDFNGTDGNFPTGSLIISGATMFGMTNEGGMYGYGNIFAIDTNGGGYRDLFDFNDTLGSYPYGSLLLSGGTLYGMTANGGTANDGTIFSIDSNGTNFRNLFNFSGATGTNPWGSLIQWDGTFYGMTKLGGANHDGVIFSIDTGGSNYFNLHTFSGTDGATPWNSLTLFHKILFGATESGGTGGEGLVFSDTLQLLITATVVANVQCNGESNGILTASAGGRPGPYKYKWEPGGATTATITGLSAGTYTLEVKDKVHDTASIVVTISQPAPLTVTANVTSNITGCFGDSNGSAAAIAGGDTILNLISTVAGNNIQGYEGDRGPATSAEFYTPCDVTFDLAGSYYIPDEHNSVIRQVNPSGIINTFAGNSIIGYSGDGGPATSAELDYPSGVLTDRAGNLYIADEYNDVVRQVNSSGIINTFAGNGYYGYSGDGGPASAAELISPTRMAKDTSGNIYIADQGNNVVRMVNPSSIISTVAGNGTQGYSGDGGPATAAELASPIGLGVDASGNLYIADISNNVVREVNTSGIISTVAGNYASGAGYSGDGGAATSAELSGPVDVTVDASGNLFISDKQNNVIRKVNTSGIISTFAGINVAGFSGNGGPATSAELDSPRGICLDVPGNLYIAEGFNNDIRKVTYTNYTYLWSPAGGTNSTASNLTAGTYTITVTDNFGCTATAPVVITQPALLSIAPLSKAVCSGDTAILNPSISGGALPYSYSWTPSTGLNCSTCGSPVATPSASICYTLAVTDNEGCSTTNSLLCITVDSLPIVNITRPSPDTVCSTIPAITLSGNPAGGAFSGGSYISGGKFYPNLATSGVFNLFTYTFTNTNGCVGAATDSIMVENCTGIEQLSVVSNQWSVYPNPGNGMFTIQSSVVNGQWSVEVYNVLGEEVYSQLNIQSSTFNIDLQSQPDGIYLVRILSKNGKLTDQAKVMKAQ